MKNWSLSSKLYFVICVLIVSNLSTVAIGLNKLSTLNDSMENINNVLYKRIDILNDINTNQLNLSIKIRDIMLSTNLEAQKKIGESVDKLKAKQDEDLNSFIAMASEKGKLQAQHYIEESNRWFETAKEAMALSYEQKNKEAAAISTTKMAPLRVKMGSTLQEIITLNETRMTDASKAAAEDYIQARNQIFVISFLAIAFSLGLGIFIIRNLSKTINNIITNLNSNADKVAAASTEIAAASEELSQATTEQAASLQETSSSVEEINSMINANSENAKKSSTISTKSLDTAEKGKSVVQDMIGAIAEINNSNNDIVNQIDDTNKEIEKIVVIINEIGNKTKVINDIVFQTKLLSFNASVEAARAGEQGKGFAVVAEEVGNLAAMSGTAALEITNMLEDSTKAVESIVRDSKDKMSKLILSGKDKVDTGTRIAHECGDVLNDIVISVASVSKMVNEISSASQEQAQGVQEITKAIAQLDQVTQENTSNSAESANAAAGLSNQAEVLNSLVQELVQTIQGQKSA